MIITIQFEFVIKYRRPLFAFKFKTQSIRFIWEVQKFSTNLTHWIKNINSPDLLIKKPYLSIKNYGGVHSRLFLRNFDNFCYIDGILFFKSPVRPIVFIQSAQLSDHIYYWVCLPYNNNDNLSLSCPRKILGHSDNYSLCIWISWCMFKLLYLCENTNIFVQT